MADFDLIDLATNQPVAMSAEDATAGYMSGKFALPGHMTEVEVTSSTGKTGVIDTSRLAEALKSGKYRLASEQERLARAAKNQGGQAFLEAAASELTLGLSDVALREAGVKGLAERRETGEATLGKVTGFGAGLLAGGGLAGAAVRGGERALVKTATGAALKEAGEAAAQKAIRGIITNQAASQAVANGLGRVVRSGAEGFLYGAGAELSEEALGDANYNAERILAAGGMGALIGGALDAGLVGLGARSAARRSVNEALAAGRELRAAGAGLEGLTGATQHIPQSAIGAARSLGTKLEGLSADEVRSVINRLTDEPLSAGGEGYLKQLWGKMRGGVNRAAEKIAGVRPGIIDDLSTPERLAVIREGRAALDDVGRKFSAVVNDVRAASKEDAQLAFQHLRPELRDVAIPAGNAPGMVAAAADSLEALQSQVKDFVANSHRLGMTANAAASQVRWVNEAIAKVRAKAFADAGVPPAFVRRLQREVAPGVVETVEEQGARTLRELADVPGIDHAAVARNLYDELDSLKNVMGAQSRFGEQLSSAGEKAAQGLFQNMHAGLKLHLQDDAVYGVLGTAQREINEAASARIAAINDLEKVIKFNPAGEVDSASVASFLNSLKSMRGDKAVQALDAYAAAEARFAAAAERHLGAAGAKAKAAARLEGLASVRAELEDKVRTLNLVDEMTRRENEMLGGGIMAAGALPGLLMGNLPGAAVGALAGGLLRPGRMLKMRAHLAHAMDSLDGTVREKTAALAAGLTKAAPSRETMMRGLTRSTIAMLEARNDEERQAAYHARVAELDRLADPYHFHSHTAAQLGGMEQQAPAHAMASSLKATEAVTFLLAGRPMPKAGVGAAFDPLNPDPKPPSPSAADIERWAKMDAAVQNPLRVLEDPNTSRSEMEAVAKVYPQFANQVRASLQDHISRRKTPLSGAQRRHAARVLGLPEFNAGNLAKWQARFAPTTPGTATGGVPSPTAKAPKIPRSSVLMPTSDAVLRRETARR